MEGIQGAVGLVCIRISVGCGVGHEGDRPVPRTVGNGCFRCAQVSDSVTHPRGTGTLTVWLLAQGWTATAIAEAPERHPRPIGRWASAFGEGSLRRPWRLSRRGRPPRPGRGEAGRVEGGSTGIARDGGHRLGQRELEDGPSVCIRALRHQREPQQLSELPAPASSGRWLSGATAWCKGSWRRNAHVSSACPQLRCRSTSTTKPGCASGAPSRQPDGPTPYPPASSGRR